jgi:ABC-2 type transport system permease protein
MAFLVGMWAFFSVGSVWGIKLSKNIISDIMSGAVIPLVLFPQWFVNIANLLPFQAIFNIPLSIYIGRITGINVFFSYAQQIFWIFVLGSLSYVAWKRVEKKIVVQGG